MWNLHFRFANLEVRKEICAWIGSNRFLRVFHTIVDYKIDNQRSSIGKIAELIDVKRLAFDTI